MKLDVLRIAKIHYPYSDYSNVSGNSNVTVVLPLVFCPNVRRFVEPHSTLNNVASVAVDHYVSTMTEQETIHCLIKHPLLSNKQAIHFHRHHDHNFVGLSMVQPSFQVTMLNIDCRRLDDRRICYCTFVFVCEANSNCRSMNRDRDLIVVDDKRMMLELMMFEEDIDHCCYLNAMEYHKRFHSKQNNL